MSAADTAAVKARAETLVALASKTFVTVTSPVGTKIPAPYLLIHPTEGTPEATRLTGPPITEHPEFTLHIVGGSADQVQVIYGLLKAAFVVNGFMVPPTIAGRRNWGGWWRSPLPIQTDNDVTPALIFAVVELGWTSEPA